MRDDLHFPTPLARARAIGPLVADAADAIERDQRIPRALLASLHELHLFRLLLPGSAGGEETHPGAYLRAVEEIGRHDGSVAWCMFVANSSALIAAYLDPAAARAIYADPHASIAWGTARRRSCPACQAAIASAGVGASPAAAVMRPGWARTATSRNWTGRCA